MMVLVDTPVWSLALRRRRKDLSVEEQRTADALANLIRDGRAQIAGPIRQELLSGMRKEEHFRSLRDYLRAFDEPSLESDDFEEAAAMSNRCRARGITGSAIDFLICAVAHRRGWQIFTLDRDFTLYAKALPVVLYDRR
ncbi:MAG TPA: PIN domain-containing protein [Terriglobales bacterium]|nr:PIN domain-containing protein [Terriglobales bacterium]